MSLGTVSPRRSLIASGLVVGAVLAVVVVVAVTGRGDRGAADAAAPGQQPPTDRATHSEDDESAESDPASSDDTDEPDDPAASEARQQHADLADEQLAAARGRAEAWVRDHLTWRHDEARQARRKRLTTHMTDRLAADYDGWHGTAEIAHRKDVQWVSTADVQHSYAETTTPERAVVVVMATQHITTRDGDRREQASHTVEVVPRQGEWRVDGMVL